MKLVIGLIGEKGGGKETFGLILADLLKDNGISFYHTHFSDILGDTLDIWSLPRTRKNLQDIAIVMVKHWGGNTLTKAMISRIEKIDSEVILVDGVRWPSDVEMIRSFDNNLLIYITADIDIRFERTKLRGQKTGESGSSYEQFLKEEETLTEINIKKIGALADIVIDNNGDKDHLKAAIRMPYEKIILPKIECGVVKV